MSSKLDFNGQSVFSFHLDESVFMASVELGSGPSDRGCFPCLMFTFDDLRLFWIVLFLRYIGGSHVRPGGRWRFQGL